MGARPPTGRNPILATLDPHGRLPQPAYRRLLVRLILLEAVLSCAAIWSATQGLRPLALALIACAALVGIAGLPPLVRRLHDRDRTGWWLAPVLILFAASYTPR